jgi:hypothetical protein
MGNSPVNPHPLERVFNSFSVPWREDQPVGPRWLPDEVADESNVRNGSKADIAPQPQFWLCSPMRYLRFKPNDLGKAAFNRQPLVIGGNDLLLERYETVIRFLRVRP